MIPVYRATCGAPSTCIHQDLRTTSHTDATLATTVVLCQAEQALTLTEQALSLLLEGTIEQLEEEPRQAVQCPRAGQIGQAMSILDRCVRANPLDALANFLLDARLRQVRPEVPGLEGGGE